MRERERERETDQKRDRERERERENTSLRERLQPLETGYTLFAPRAPEGVYIKLL